MGFKTVLFSRGNAAAEAAANSEFVGGDSQFLDTSAPAMTADATAAAPATPDSDGDAPLRLRDALRRRVNADAGVTAADAGAGFKLPLIGHLPAQRQLSLLSTAGGQPGHQRRLRRAQLAQQRQHLDPDPDRQRCADALAAYRQGRAERGGRQRRGVPRTRREPQ